MNARELWESLLAGRPGHRPLLDLGATGIGAPWSAREGAELSDFVNAEGEHGAARETCGPLSSYLPREVLAACPDPGSSHPLARASLRQIRRLPRLASDVRRCKRMAPSPVPSTDPDHIIAVSPPCPGLLQLGMTMRGPWRFLDDLSRDDPVVDALLEWAQDVLTASYLDLLGESGRVDVVAYGDDLAYGGAPFVSPAEFRRHITPRTSDLLSCIRRHAGGQAAILFHSCGQVAPLLSQILTLETELLDLEPSLFGGVSALRRRLPGDVVLHGVTPLPELGVAATRNDHVTTRRIMEEVARAQPVIVSSPDLGQPDRDADVVRGAAWLRSHQGLPAGEDFLAPARLAL